MPRISDDRLELLCERCGYGIGGLPAGAKCPECARPVADSMPHARPGSPWQIDPSAASWFATNWATLSRPAATMRTARIDSRSSRRLFIINCFAAAAPYGALAGLFMLVGVLGTAVPLWDDEIHIGAFALGALYVFTALFGVWAAHWIPLLVVLLVAAVILRALGRLHGWRVTWRVAITVTAHASAVAFLMPLLFVIGMMLGFLTAIMLGEVGLFLGSFVEMLGFTVVAALPTVGVLAAFLRIGLRECRYANPPLSYDPPP